ncbi:hypothetical protein R80B4_00164 [Fibrobacteres bacterium R8-0-B4]
MSIITKYGRTLLLSAVLAVGLLGLSGCDRVNGEDDEGDDGNGGDGGNGSFTYGGQTYRTVKIGGQTWMAENLNVATAESWCYEDDPANCNKYGRLYTLASAKMACQSIGWHLSSFQEWLSLLEYAGDERRVAGKTLKARSGWNDNGNGTDDYGFSALPGGFRNGYESDWEGEFSSAGYVGAWWFEGGRDLPIVIRNTSDDISSGSSYVSDGFSVRCVQ